MTEMTAAEADDILTLRRQYYGLLTRLFLREPEAEWLAALEEGLAERADAARLLAYRAFSLLDKRQRCLKEASIAKAFATEAGVRVTSKAVQIHGAYGLSEEYPVERLFRDARCYTIPDGTTEIQKLIIGREVLGMSAFV